MGHWNFPGDLMKQFMILLSLLIRGCHKNDLLIKCNWETPYPRRGVSGADELTFLMVHLQQSAVWDG